MQDTNPIPLLDRALVVKDVTYMKLQDQYCTREQALKLAELGVWQPKESDDWKAGDFYSVDPFVSEMRSCILGEQEDAPYDMYQPVKLFSVAELGMMLPYKSGDDSSCPYFSLKDFGDNNGKDVDGFSCFQITNEFPSFVSVSDKISVYYTEAEARADLVILLIEKGEINVEEVNKMLLADR